MSPHAQYVFQPRSRSRYLAARSSMSCISSSKYAGFGDPGGELRPADPRLGMTKACMTERRDLASELTVSMVSEASWIGSGLLVSGDVGTTDSTVADVAESRNSSLRQWKRLRFALGSPPHA